MINKFYQLLDLQLVKITNLLLKYKFKIVGFVTVAFLIIIGLYLPYVNLILSYKMVVFLILILFLIFFRINWRTTLTFVLLLFVVSFLLNMFGFIIIANTIGDYIYGLLLLVLIEYFILI